MLLFTRISASFSLFGQSGSCQHVSVYALLTQPGCFAGLLFDISSLVSAQSAPSPGIVFNYPLGPSSGNFTFALNIPDDSADLYFHLSGPTSYSWVAVGTGNEMKNSLMMIVYAGASGKSLFSTNTCPKRLRN